ncbi:MAG: hypothetical protein JXR96_30535 [Deltaproteobacteria bacterium]|nr:hypothetical protein [Deltaproteobacteria bacterium]
MQLLSNLRGAALSQAIDEARAILSWPARLRHASADCPWLAGVFEGALDPRLALVGWASVRHAYEYEYLQCNLNEVQMIHTVAGFARRLDPSFDPPAVVIDRGNTIQTAYGCGGGQEWEKRGDAMSGVLFRDEVTEHAAETENDGAWVPYGLAEGCQLRVHRHDYLGGRYSFTATGPTPAVLEIAALWGEMTRGGG